jgi:hypothetical protein
MRYLSKFVCTLASFSPVYLASTMTTTVSTSRLHGTSSKLRVRRHQRCSRRQRRSISSNERRHQGSRVQKQGCELSDGYRSDCRVQLQLRYSRRLQWLKISSLRRRSCLYSHCLHQRSPGAG